MDADKLKIQKIESFLKQFQSYIALIIIVVVATLINIKDGENVFLSVPNLMNVLRAVSETGIIAIGMTMILILGDIDLSVGSIVGLVSTGCASLMVRNGLGMFPAVLLSLLIGGLYGLFNGLCVTKLKLQAFIVTLARMNIARGLARFWSNGVGIPLAYGEGEGFRSNTRAGNHIYKLTFDLPMCAFKDIFWKKGLCNRWKQKCILSCRYTCRQNKDNSIYTLQYVICGSGYDTCGTDKSGWT